MARIRTVKPEHWSDKNLPNISLQAHLLWIATWNFSDDKGIFEADPLLLKSRIFPRRTDIRTDQVSLWLDQLVKARYIIPFEYKNESYYITRTFVAHQRIDKPQASKIPDNVINTVFQDRSENVPRTVIPIEESKVKEKERRVYRAFAHLKIFEDEMTLLYEAGYNQGEIDSILDAIQNYKKNKNYTSLYLTAKKWLEKEKNSAKKENGTSKIDRIIDGGQRINDAIQNGLLDGIN